MNFLARAHKKRMGQGDNRNYPNSGTLRSVFRNLVAIPIFARGGDHIVIEREICAVRPPKCWTVWTLDRRRQWLDTFSGPVEVC